MDKQNIMAKKKIVRFWTQEEYVSCVRALFMRDFIGQDRPLPQSNRNSNPSLVVNPTCPKCNLHFDHCLVTQNPTPLRGQVLLIRPTSLICMQTTKYGDTSFH